MPTISRIFGHPEFAGLKHKHDIENLVKALGYQKDPRLRIRIATWTGKFSPDGKTLSGEFSLFADSCVTDFEITR